MSPTININDRFLPGRSGAEIIAGASAAAGVQKGYTTHKASASTLMLTWRHRPTWAIIVGVIGLLVFLLGALFFLVKDTDTITITTIDQDGGTLVNAVGSGSAPMVAFLHGFLDPAEPV